MRAVLAIVGIVIMAALIGFGANESVLQFAGNVGGEIPLVGTWLNAVSSFTRESLSGSFSGTFVTVLRMMLQCISSNILDSLFLGLLVSLASDGVNALTGDWNRFKDVGTTIVVSLVGVFLLYVMKKSGETAYAVLVLIGNIGLLLLGIGIMLSGRMPMLSVRSFIFDALSGMLEGASSVGLFCSLLLLPSMIRAGIGFIGIAVWIVCLVLLVAVAVLVSYFNRAFFGR
jgi:hypothetical protein